MYRATGSLTEMVAGIGSTLSWARRQTSLTAAPICLSLTSRYLVKSWISYSGIRISSWVTVGRSISTKCNHVCDGFSIHQISSSNSSLSSNINLSTEAVVDLDQVSNCTSVGVTVPFVKDVIGSIFLDQIVTFDLICEIRIQLLVNVEDLVVSLKLLWRGFLDGGFRENGVMLS